MILVTGATGFVGSALVATLCERHVATRACVRRANFAIAPGAETARIDAIDANTDWRDALNGIDVVIHAAARVHVMDETSTNPLEEFRRVNVAGTLNLARQARDAGVRRLVFISSIKVNGEFTAQGQPFSADDAPAPLDPYGVSKLEAEEGLREIAAQGGMEVVIIRPPLVYGPGVGANFRAMMCWLSRGVPLPLGAIHNARSLVGIDNLVSLIVTCSDHPAAANQTFLVSDGDDMSTTQLLRSLGHALGRPARLVPVPAGLIRLGAAMLGRPGIAQRLCGSLQVDIVKTRSLLGWQPPASIEDGLKKTAEDFEREASI